VANGATASGSETARRNRVWSYPAKAPLDNDSTDRSRYLVDIGTWLTGPNTTDSRQYVRRVVDNLNTSATTGGTGFVSANTATGYIGGDYLAATVQPSISSSVTYSAAKFPDGNYFVDVYIPSGFATSDLSVGATYHINQGGITVATITLDQAHNRGWQRLSTNRFVHSNASAAPLTVSVVDTKAGSDTGTESVVADAVRFVTDADWSVNSTPVMVSTSINDAGSTANRDVVVVASETGRLTCMDAHGDPTTGAPPKVYWTYPSEVSTGDPNAAIGQDGGGQEDPVSFDISSAMVRNVSGVDLLTIGSTNGRVYCLEMVGRGDNSGSTPGTTKRRWTYPDDFRPDAPATAQVPTALGAIKGSVVAATIGGNEAVIVATTSGKIIALDAAGDATKRTTSVIWDYPGGAATIGSIEQTPTYDAANHRLFFACPAVGAPSIGTVYSLDTDTGLVNWSVTSAGVGFGDFGTASLLYLDNATSTIGDTVYCVDKNGYIYALDASNGSARWSAQEAGTGSNAGLSFVYMRTYDSTATLTSAIPTVLVATTDGQLLGFYADGSLNTQSTHRNWNSYTLKGNNQKSSFAVGGFPNTAAAQHCHIYIGDSLGNILAFSSED
ncbi:MAG: PQQ-binding-like beta-propeller repeat protein, partial [Armatimonadota bacterium]